MTWFKKKRTMFEVEKALTEAKARLGVFKQTFVMQSTFTDKQRERLMDLEAKKGVLEMELNKVKFEEVVDDGKTS